MPPIEGMRPGASPADDGYERPLGPAEFSQAIRRFGEDELAAHGRWEDGTARLRSFGGGRVGYPQHVLPRKRDDRGRVVLDLPRCEACDLEFWPAEGLDAHRVAEHAAESG